MGKEAALHHLDRARAALERGAGQRALGWVIEAWREYPAESLADLVELLTEHLAELRSSSPVEIRAEVLAAWTPPAPNTSAARFDPNLSSNAIDAASDALLERIDDAKLDPTADRSPDAGDPEARRRPIRKRIGGTSRLSWRCASARGSSDCAASASSVHGSRRTGSWRCEAA